MGRNPDLDIQNLASASPAFYASLEQRKRRKIHLAMSTELPRYYFRIRENGATVFEIDTENRHRRIEMTQIAMANTRSGEIKPHGNRALSDAETAVIKDWLAERQEVLATRAMDDIYRAMDYLNLTTHWAQTKATDAELDDVTDGLLLAMHDLRSVLVRKSADRLSRKDD